MARDPRLLDDFHPRALQLLSSPRKVPIPQTLDGLSLAPSDYRADACLAALSEAYLGDASQPRLAALCSALHAELSAQRNADHYAYAHWLAARAAAPAPAEEEAEACYQALLGRLARGETRGLKEAEAAGANAVLLRAFAHAFAVDVLLVSPLFPEKIVLAARACPLLPRQGTLLLGVMASNQFGYFHPAPVEPSPSPQQHSVAPPESNTTVEHNPISSSSSSSSLTTTPTTTTSLPSSTPTPSTDPKPKATSSKPPTHFGTPQGPTVSIQPATGKTGLVTQDLTPEQREELRIAKAIESQATRPSSSTTTPTSSSPQQPGPSSNSETAAPKENWRAKREREEREAAERAERQDRERQERIASIEKAAVESQTARDAQASTGWAQRESENPNAGLREISMDPRAWSAEDVSVWLQKQGAPSELRAHLFKHQVAGTQLLSLDASHALLANHPNAAQLAEWIAELQIGVENIIAMTQ